MAIELPNPNYVWRYSATLTRAQKAAMETKEKQQPKKPMPNLIMKLPAELRNRVYELVLVDNNPRIIRSGKIKDPALLRTGCRIRLEARGIYYCLNEFSLTVSVNRLEHLRFWLAYIKQTCGKVTGSLCVRGCRFKDVGKLLPLAEIAFGGMHVKKVTTTLLEGFAMLGVVRSVARLGTTGKTQKCSARMVEVRFDEWMLDLLANKDSILMSRQLSESLRLARGPTCGVDNWRKVNERSQALVDGRKTGEVVEDSPDPDDLPPANTDHWGLGTRRASGWTTVN